MDSPFAGVLTVFTLVLANAFFVATEFAIVAVRRSRLDELLAKGHPTAAAAKDVTSHLDTYIAACQLGITMASLALGWIGEPVVAGLLEPVLEAVAAQFTPAAAHGIAIGLSFGAITALHIVIGELAPKGLALQYPEGTALWVARPMQIFEFVFHWPIALLNGVGNGVLRLFGVRPASGHEMVHSVEELRLLVTGSQNAGVVEESEARIASRAFEFGELTAGDLMTPRTEVEAVPATIPRDELLSRATATEHSRLLVYEGTLDQMVGMLRVRDLVALLDRPGEAFDLGRLVRPLLYVPEAQHADDLLEELRRTRQQLAVVVDEYGGTAGIVTLEDLMEALVGRLDEERAAGDQEQQVSVGGAILDSSLVFDGLTRLDEFEESTGLRLDGKVHDQAKTLGGFAMASLGRMPAVGDQVPVAGRVLRIEELDGRRVASLRLLPNGSPVA